MHPRFRFSVSGLQSLPGYEGVPAHDFMVFYPATPNAPRNNAIYFFKDSPETGLERLSGVRESLFLVPATEVDRFAPLTSENLVVPVSNPRLEFARVLGHAAAEERDQRTYRMLPHGAVVGENTQLGTGVILEPGCFVDHDVIIGDRSVIRSGARIRRWVEIGTDSEVRENAVVGGAGFGFERASDGTPVRLPHFGGVQIGNRVEIGAVTTVVGGTIDPTIVEDDVKVDDHVHIAHNCKLRRSAIVTACAELSGSVEVGEYAWVGPNSSVLQGLRLGAHCFVGLGAVVTKSLPDGVTVAGNPAALTRSLKAFNEAKERLLKAVQEGRI